MLESMHPASRYLKAALAAPVAARSANRTEVLMPVYTPPGMWIREHRLEP